MKGRATTDQIQVILNTFAGKGVDLASRSNMASVVWDVALGMYRHVVITGIKGDDGRAVELQKSTTHVQWRYAGDSNWTNILPLTDITGPSGPNVVQTGTSTNIDGILKGSGNAIARAVPGTDYVAASDARLTDARTPSDSSVSYSKVASALKQKSTVTASVDLSANGIGAITLTTNTAFTFTNFELNKSYLLIITANGFTPSWAAGAKHIPVTGNEAFGTSGGFYVNLTCIDATPGSEKLLTTIMKGA